MSSVGQLDAGVEVLNRLVVPLLDLAEVDVGQHRAAEDQRLLDLFQIVGGDDRAHDERNMDDLAADLLRLLQLFVVHGAVGAAEVEGLGGHLLDAAARADRLVIDLDALGLVVLGRPLRHHRVHERGPAAVDARLSTRPAAETGGRQTGCSQEHGPQDGTHRTPPKSFSVSLHSRLAQEALYSARERIRVGMMSNE